MSEATDAKRTGRANRDPIKQKVSWEPARWGGTNFQAQWLEVGPTIIRVRRSGIAKLFGIAFAFGGILTLGVIGTAGYVHNDLGSVIAALIIGGLFLGVGFGISHSWKKRLLTFDKRQGYYYAPGYGDASVKHDRGKRGELKDIYALQVLAERIHKGDSKYTSYELNLVLVDAERVNVMDHGDMEELKKAALVLARFLGVPVWGGMASKRTGSDEIQASKKKPSTAIGCLLISIFLAPIIMLALQMFFFSMSG